MTNNNSSDDGCRPPETILQFGTGVFLLGFVDWIVEQLNQASDFNAGVVALKARPGNSAALEPLNRHGGEFHVALKGYAGGELVNRVETIHCLRRAINPFEDIVAAEASVRSEQLQWVVSNTTEAGIVYLKQPAPEHATPETFPAMLTALLYTRYQHFGGAAERGLAVLCCELIENNASRLREIVGRHATDWHLPADFIHWLDSANAFCNTLVDRIVTGESRAQAEAGLAADALLIEAEAFHAWVIEAPDWVRRKLPIRQAGLEVEFVDDLLPARERKVRVLNGAHTASFALSLMAGVPTVYQSMQTGYLRAYLEQLLQQEVAPTLGGDRTANETYISAILQRFDNPFIEHRWQDIALNAVSKWRARLLPTLIDSHQQTAEYPPLIVLSLAALLCFYRSDAMPVRDAPAVVEAIARAFVGQDDLESGVSSVLASSAVWGELLPALPGLSQRVAEAMEALLSDGVENVLHSRLQAG